MNTGASLRCQLRKLLQDREEHVLKKMDFSGIFSESHQFAVKPYSKMCPDTAFKAIAIQLRY
jgi:hypothetical protein